MSGSLDDGKTKLLDAREYALIITIDMNGVVDVQSQRISKESAAEYLRMLADAFAPHVGALLGVPEAPKEEEQ